MIQAYLPVLVLFVLALGLGLLVLGMTFLLGPRNPSPVKDDTYESGLTPIGPGRRRVPVRYYLIATLFILFDIEVIYLFPWAARFKALSAPVAQGGRFREPAAEPVAPGIKLGARVRHARFGDGVILNLEGQGAQARVQVNFENQGAKWLMLSYANLETVR